MSLITRRSLLRGLFAAPAVVAAGSLMPVKLWKPDAGRHFFEMPVSRLWRIYADDRLIYEDVEAPPPVFEIPPEAIVEGRIPEVTLECGGVRGRDWLTPALRLA
jgi:hypothetical protein